MFHAATGSHVVPAEIARLIVSPQAHARRKKLLAALGWLREANPVGRVETDEFAPFWIVSRHADILSVSRQHDIFHNGDHATALVPRVTDARIRALTGGSPHLIRTLVHMDAPDHAEYRRVSQTWFTQQGIHALQDRIRTVARDCLDRMRALGKECDFAREIARPFPLRVMMGILGIPPEDAAHVLALTERFFHGQDALSGRDPARHAVHLRGVLADFTDYFKPLLATRQNAPREDLITAIAQARINGAPIPELEAISYLLILATAGHHTTSSSIAGGAWALSQRREVFDRVAVDRSLVPGLVEEAVRWTTPVQHFMRTATRETELNGRRIAAGDWLMLNYLSGSRDERVFDSPDQFRVDRPTAHTASFGHGVHVCLGQHLARLEMRIFFEEMLESVDRMELAGEPRLCASVFVGGPTAVPLRYRLRGR